MYGSLWEAMSILTTAFYQKIARKFVYKNSDLILARSWKLKEKIEKEGYKGNVIVSPSSTDTSFFKHLTIRLNLDQNGISSPQIKLS